jgi:hypothetical protein
MLTLYLIAMLDWVDVFLFTIHGCDRYQIQEFPEDHPFVHGPLGGSAVADDLPEGMHRRLAVLWQHGRTLGGSAVANAQLPGRGTDWMQNETSTDWMQNETSMLDVDLPDALVPWMKNQMDCANPKSDLVVGFMVTYFCSFIIVTGLILMTMFMGAIAVSMTNVTRQLERGSRREEKECDLPATVSPIPEVSKNNFWLAKLFLLKGTMVDFEVAKAALPGRVAHKYERRLEYITTKIGGLVYLSTFTEMEKNAMFTHAKMTELLGKAFEFLETDEKLGASAEDRLQIQSRRNLYKVRPGETQMFGGVTDSALRDTLRVGEEISDGITDITDDISDGIADITNQLGISDNLDQLSHGLGNIGANIARELQCDGSGRRGSKSNLGENSKRNLVENIEDELIADVEKGIKIIRQEVGQVEDEVNYQRRSFTDKLVRGYATLSWSCYRIQQWKFHKVRVFKTIINCAIVMVSIEFLYYSQMGYQRTREAMKEQSMTAMVAQYAFLVECVIKICGNGYARTFIGC